MSDLLAGEELLAVNESHARPGNIFQKHAIGLRRPRQAGQSRAAAQGCLAAQVEPAEPSPFLEIGRHRSAAREENRPTARATRFWHGIAAINCST